MVGYEILSINFHNILLRCGRFIIRRFVLATVLVLLLSVSVTLPLWAIGAVRGSVIAPDLYKLGEVNTNGHNADPCKVMLESVKRVIELTPTQAKENIYKQYRSMPVTLSYLMGVRYVVGPKEVTSYSQDATAQMSDRERYSLAIASYRACKKQLALTRNK